MMFSKKQLFQLIWPLLIEQLLAVLVGMADVLMVSSVGEAAVSGVSLVDTIGVLMIQVFSALATGGAVVVAQFLGQKHEKDAAIAANQLFLLMLSVSLFFMIGSLTFCRGLIDLFFGQAEEAVLSNAEIYFFLSAISYPFIGLYNAAAAVFRAAGNSKISMIASLIMNGINVGGNALCIYLLQMGVEGVALPTLVSRMVAAIFLMILLFQKKCQLPIRQNFSLRLQPTLMKKVLLIGIPNGVENLLFHSGKLILQSLVSTLGTAAIAGYAVAANLATIHYLPGQAIGLAMITVCGQCVGAKKYSQVRFYTKRLVGLNYIILLFLAGITVLFVSPIVSIYRLSSAAFAVATKMLILHAIIMLIWPMAFCLPNSLRAASDVNFTMIISVASMWLFRIGSSYLFVCGFRLGIESIWIAMGIDWLCRAVFYLCRFHGKKWLEQSIAT